MPEIVYKYLEKRLSDMDSWVLWHYFGLQEKNLAVCVFKLLRPVYHSNGYSKHRSTGDVKFG